MECSPLKRWSKTNRLLDFLLCRNLPLDLPTSPVCILACSSSRLALENDLPQAGNPHTCPLAAILFVLPNPKRGLLCETAVSPRRKNKMAACNQCPQDGGDIFPNLPSYARANAEYYNYCSLWWWELYARNRMESLASCECFESQSGDQVDRLCECSFRKDEYSRPGACCADNSCYGTLGENWKSSVWTYDQRFDNNCGWNQFPIAPKGRQSGRRPKGSDYGNHIWNGTQRYCDNSAGCDENLPYQGSEDPETIEMDVNEDFRKFLEQSKRYREERDKGRYWSRMGSRLNFAVSRIN